jgi:VIT1/CCC1 family predicted Fe2+/Mn2+ transporter
MITKHDLEYVGHESMADYYEEIAQQIEQNELSTANDMKSKLSKATTTRLRGLHFRGILL